MGNHAFAIKDFNKALELDPSNSDCYYFKGISRLKAKDYSEALEDFKK